MKAPQKANCDLPSQNRSGEIINQSSQVLKLWTDFLRREHHVFSESDKEVANQLKESRNSFERFVGRLVLLGSNAPPSGLLIEAVQNACTEGPEAFGKYAKDVLVLQLRLPAGVLERPPIMDFISAAANSEDISCRLNVCHVLEKMNTSGADDLLRMLENDPDDRVRRNARLSRLAL